MPAAGFFSDDTVQEVLPGVQLYMHPRSRFVFVRLWNKDTQEYVGQQGNLITQRHVGGS